MKEITSNEKYVLTLVDPDEVFDILGNGDGDDLYCRILKGSFQKATHLLKSLTVATVKCYIEKAKDNNPNEFIIFYRITENKRDRKLRIRFDDEDVELVEKDILESDRVCGSGPCGSQKCPLHEYRRCWEMVDKYNNGEYEEV